MPLTKVDNTAALVVIELQKSMAGLPTVHPVADVVKQASVLADAFRRHGLPVVLVNVAGGAPARAEQTRSRGEPPADWTELVPELNRQRTWVAFTNTVLNEHLKKLGVTQVVIAGVVTNLLHERRSD